MRCGPASRGRSSHCTVRESNPLSQRRQSKAATAAKQRRCNVRVTRRIATTPAAPEKDAPPLAPLGRKLKKRVARGREPIEARLDLHGFTQTQAHAALLRFLHRAQSDGVRIALVVTGKGAAKEPTGTTARLRRAFSSGRCRLWLSLPEFRSLVVGFEDAHLGHGGQGALYVRLRRAR